MALASTGFIGSSYKSSWEPLLGPPCSSQHFLATPGSWLFKSKWLSLLLLELLLALPLASLGMVLHGSVPELQAPWVDS